MRQSLMQAMTLKIKGKAMG